jgi:hypothetical protein
MENRVTCAISHVIVRPDSSHTITPCYCGQEFLKNGIKILAQRTFAWYTVIAMHDEDVIKLRGLSG